MKRKNFVIIAIVLILLIIGSIVTSGSYSSRIKDADGTPRAPDTVTEYLVHTQTVDDATTQPTLSIVANDSGRTTTHVTITLTSTVTVRETFAASLSDMKGSYILAGGQNGSWFTNSQYARLFQIFPSTNSTFWLDLGTGPGTVWTGGANNSDSLISGWGTGPDPGSPNPYLYLYNGTAPVNESSIEASSEAEWKGGDIFATSSNGSTWLVSGMGSGYLHQTKITSPLKRPVPSTNHLSVGLFDGSTFVDLSTKLPVQMDGILYANAFNGANWLVGGGYSSNGVLLSFDGRSFTQLTSAISSAVPTFHSVQSIAWNGHYWLIGGIGFIAEYDGRQFTDLTNRLIDVLPAKALSSHLFSVNSITWNGSSWLLGGGAPIAINTGASSSWLAAFNSVYFRDLTSELPSSVTQSNASSSVLSISYGQSMGDWVIGGYANGRGMLLLLNNNGQVKDLSSLLSDASYIDWVGVY